MEPDLPGWADSRLSSEEVADLTVEFEQVLAHPTLDALLALDSTAFEHFVGFVFTCAGYGVRYVAHKKFPGGPGVDLLLYAGKAGRPIAGIEARRYAPGNKLERGQVNEFTGVLNNNSAGCALGYLVTTSGFEKNAVIAAEQSARIKIHLVDGSHFVRYVKFVAGSRTELSPSTPLAPDVLEVADHLAEESGKHPRHTRIVAVANPKGGVAKTTTAMNVGFALAGRHEKRVLLVDLDGQASLTRELPAQLSAGASTSEPPPPDRFTIANYLDGHTDLKSLIRPTRFPPISLIPSPANPALWMQRGPNPDRELAFAADLRAIGSIAAEGNAQQAMQFDWIVLDTPATITLGMRMALAAADYVLVPAYAEPFAISGAPSAVDLTRTMDALLGTRENRILGCVITRWRESANASKDRAALTLKLGARHVRMLGDIPLDDKINAVHRELIEGKNRHHFWGNAPLKGAALAYDALAQEVIDHAV
jgi:chromosome partitioning protein